MIKMFYTWKKFNTNKGILNLILMEFDYCMIILNNIIDLQKVITRITPNAVIPACIYNMSVML